MTSLGISPDRAERSFAVYVAATVLAELTIQMVAVAISWQVYYLTGSALNLGLIGLTEFAPTVCFTLLVGMVADRFNRKLIVCVCLGAQSLILAALTTASLAGLIDRNLLLAVVFLLGSANAFFGPAMTSMLANVVEREQFSKQMARATSASQMASLLGPALGGFLYALNPSAVYAAATLIAALSAALMVFLRVAQRRIPQERASVTSVLSGLTFIRQRRIILGAILMDLFAVLFGGATALLPIYARTILKVGALGLGVLRSAPAFGAGVMSLALARRPIRDRVGHRMFLAVFLFGLATLVFALSRSFYLSLAMLTALGAADVISMVIRSTLVLAETPDAMRGRVSSVNNLFVGTSNQLGAFESGVTAGWMGAVAAAVVGGLGTIVVVALWIRLFPALFGVNEFPKEET